MSSDKLHVCEDGDKWYIQEDPEDETWIAEFNTEKDAIEYVKTLENGKTALIDLGDIWALIYYGEIQTTLGKIRLNHVEGQNYELKKLALDARMEYLTNKATHNKTLGEIMPDISKEEYEN